MLLSTQLHLWCFSLPGTASCCRLLLHHDNPKYVGSGDPVYVIRWTLNAPVDSSPLRFFLHYITPLPTAAPLVKTEELNSEEERNLPESWPWAFPISPLERFPSSLTEQELQSYVIIFIRAGWLFRLLALRDETDKNGEFDYFNRQI